MPLEEATRIVEENLGWKRSSEGPAGNATVPLMRVAERRSYTCVWHQPHIFVFSGSIDCATIAVGDRQW